MRRAPAGTVRIVEKLVVIAGGVEVAMIAGGASSGGDSGWR